MSRIDFDLTFHIQVSFVSLVEKLAEACHI